MAIIDSERVTAPPPSNGRVEVVYWEKWTGFEADAMRAVVDRFNRKQSRIHVQFLTISGIQDKTLMATAGGNPPDIAGLEGPNVAQYADDHALTPLDDLCKSAGINADQYVPVYWDVCSYRGHVYGLPTTPMSTALHYNRKLLARAGLDPNHAPATIEEMDAMAARLTRKGPNGHLEIAGFMPAEPGWWNWGWGALFGGRLWDGKGKITANSQENVRALEWAQSYSKRYGVDRMETFRQGFGNFSSPQNPFLAQTLGMEIQGVWMYNFISKYAPELDWAAAPFPHPADRPDLAGTSLADTDILVIPHGAHHPREAFEFIAYVQSLEGSELLNGARRQQNFLRASSPGYYTGSPNRFLGMFSNLPRNGKAVTAPKLGIWLEYQSELNNAFEQVMLMQKSPQAALDDVTHRMQPKLDEYLRVLHLRGEDLPADLSRGSDRT